MLICVSSGSRPRYRQDIIRSLALPLSGPLQFRYLKEWVSESVQGLIQSQKINGEQVLIAYADQRMPQDESVPTGPVELVPVRIATVVSAAVHGNTVSLVFSVGEFAYASNVDAFNSEVNSATRESLPKWVDGRATGLYCTEIGKQPTNIVTSVELTHWESIVNQLSEHEDFQVDDTFFTIIGLLTKAQLEKMGATLRMQAWPQALPSNSNRDVVTYYFYPRAPQSIPVLSARIGPDLRLESSDRLLLDSRYDLVKFRIKSGDPTSEFFGTRNTWLMLTAEGPSSGLLEVELPVGVRGNWVGRMVTAIVVGIGLTGAQAIPLFTRDDLSDLAKLWSALAIFGISFVVGLAAVWGIRKAV